MGLIVNTNLFALNAQRNVSKVQGGLGTSVERLSSGLRVNSAKDDAAGLAISMKLSAQVRSLNQAIRNAQDGISVVQTAEGGMNEIHNILTRMRELAQQASTGTLATSDRTALNNEFADLKSEITRISDTTEFNGLSLLDGTLSGSGVSLQVGINNTDNDRITVSGTTFYDIDASSIGLTTTNVSSIDTAANAQSMLTIVDSAIATVSTRRGNLGGVQNRLGSTIANLGIASENLTAANSRIVDADFAVETANLTKSQIILQAGIAVLGQANVLPQYALQLLR
ncbi:MAG: flagellin FliC [Nitrospiraceae bacterium]|nr:MAG: flagellin FliC [Nitrospiraceae bacterium]